MWRNKAFLSSLIMHFCLCCALVLTVKPTTLRLNGLDQPVPDIIEAVAVDNKELLRFKHQREEVETKKQEEKERIKEAAKQKILLEKQKKEEAEALKALELAKKKEALLAKQKEEKRLSDEKALQAKVAAEKKLEQAKLEAQKLRQAQEEALQSKLREELESNELKGEITRVATLIQQKLRQNWIKAYGTPAGLSCRFEVQLTATGDVFSVVLIKSSGHSAFDRSAQAAVMKSSPLPIPEGGKAKDAFKRFTFTFAPEA